MLPLIRKEIPSDFQAIEALTIAAFKNEAVPAEYFLVLKLTDNKAKGQVAYHSAFLSKG